MQQKRLYSLPEASDYLGLKISMIRKIIQKREITFIKVGKLVRFERKDLDEWADKFEKKHCRQ